MQLFQHKIALFLQLFQPFFGIKKLQLFQLFYKFHSIYCASLYLLKYKKDETLHYISCKVSSFNFYTTFCSLPGAATLSPSHVQE